MENEIDRIKRKNANRKREIEATKKKIKDYEKISKETEKANRDAAHWDRVYDEAKQKESTLERNLNRTKSLEDLEEKKEILERRIEEAKQVIEDENATSEQKRDAEASIEAYTEELGRLQPQIQQRKEALPLRERVKNIFNKLREKLRENTTTLKKLGYVVQAIVLAAGLVLGAVSLAALNGLKAGTQAVGKGLKTIGQKLGSRLPGLIRSIVSFIFKSAGQVLSFLGEHAWLLILAVVAFFMERLLKKRLRQ